MFRMFAAAAALLAGVAAAHAQDWPARQSIKVVVPFTAGSGTDIVARAVFDKVSRQINQSVYVENRGGAGTTLGSAQVSKAPPDGYTVLVNSTSHVVVASTYANLSYHPVDDFTPLAPLADLPFVLAAPSKYATLRDFVAAAKAKPGAMNYGSAGAGSSGQLFVERFRIAAGFEAPHVPFRGTPEALTEIMADRLDLFPAPAAAVVALAQDRKLAALAVSSSKRLAALPDAPTTVEAGFPGSSYNFWIGAFLPPRTPDAIVQRLSAEIKTALADPDVAGKIVALGGEAMWMGPAEFAAFAREELKVNADIVKASGYKPQ
ncbi:MAG TPA: tripartite tricarboxylate transporter substrate binding protein [Beijerinckiaceae bacterium]